MPRSLPERLREAARQDVPAHVRHPIPAAACQHVRGNVPANARQHHDAGSAVLEFTFLGLLLLVPVVYLVLTVGAVQGASFAVVGATDQAAKVFVDSETPEEAHRRAQQAVDLTLSDFGFPTQDAAVTITCGGICLEPGSSVTVTVNLKVPLPLIPTMPGLNTSAATVDSSSTQLVERFG